MTSLEHGAHLYVAEAGGDEPPAEPQGDVGVQEAAGAKPRPEDGLAASAALVSLLVSLQPWPSVGWEEQPGLPFLAPVVHLCRLWWPRGPSGLGDVPCHHGGRPAGLGLDTSQLAPPRGNGMPEAIGGSSWQDSWPRPFLIHSESLLLDRSHRLPPHLLGVHLRAGGASYERCFLPHRQPLTDPTLFMVSQAQGQSETFCEHPPAPQGVVFSFPAFFPSSCRFFPP